MTPVESMTEQNTAENDVPPAAAAYYEDDLVTLYNADCMDVLRLSGAES